MSTNNISHNRTNHDIQSLETTQVGHHLNHADD